MQFVLYFLVCLIATTVGAISGVGGGVVIKPVFDAVAGMSVSQVSFLSGCTVLAMTIVSLLRSRGEKIELKRGTLLAVGGAVGGLLGKVVFDWVKSLTGNDGLVGVVQSVIMILLTAGVGVYMAFREKIRTKNVQNAALCVIIGLALGVMSAFLGIGGGPINLVVLYYFFSMDTKQAALHSIYVIFFSQAASFVSSLAMQNVPAFDPVTLVVMVVGGVAGGFLGRAFNKKMSVRQVDMLFSILLAVITLISVYNLVHYASLL
ncbi:MAG TPA: sulfite exporter TauE/SafE family protein [Candidatus Caccousia avicola]|uniref:Probable membrane transporter protein n=1 Tax=Candidatus Caccousia avicola TaxID=2840721 RepID=A0A9D1AP71_9FIRM|nr:sulfite exporter TauE/SafE family protein [Candidatus Caccousia avicola]